MIAEFEQRLADVLGSRLPAPFTGEVDVAPGGNANAQVRLIVGVESSELLEEDFRAYRDVQLPGSTPFRRVVRLRCTVGMRVVTNKGRKDQVPALDAALFLLDAPDFRDGSALADGDDPGFLIHRMSLVGSSTALIVADDAPLVLTLSAEGWFWPVGAPEQEGEAIREALVRAGFLPLEIEPAHPRILAGGDPIDLAVRLAAVGALSLTRDAPPEVEPFGSLAIAIRDAGGRPGAGTLSGGTDGADGARIVPLTDGTAVITYTPPAAPAVDYLIVALEKDGGHQGVELGRFALRVMAR